MSEDEKLLLPGSAADETTEGFAGADKTQIGLSDNETDIGGEGVDRLSNEEVVKLKEDLSESDATHDNGSNSDPAFDDDGKSVTDLGSVNDPV